MNYREKSEKELISFLKSADNSYYNTEKRIVSDAKYDEIKDFAKKNFGSNKYFSEVGHAVKDKKVTLPFAMPSLDKIKDGSNHKFFRESSRYLLSDKIDGTSLQLIGNGSSWVSLYTRGNGVVGRDVSHLLKHIKLPQNVIKGVVRGELTIHTNDFYSGIHENFEDPRSFVNSIVTRDSVSEYIKYLKFYAYSILDEDIKYFKAFKILRTLGFNVPFYKVVNNLDSVNFILKKRRDEAPYQIDGLVVATDSYVKNTTSLPKNIVAYKALFDDETAEVVVRNVEWNVSRHGRLKPRISIVPVKLSGVTIKNLTGFHALFIKDNKVGKGTILKICRSGGVIPHIVEVIKGTKAQFPEEDYSWDETNTNIIVNSGKVLEHVKKIVHFFSTLGVEFISTGLVTKILDYYPDYKILDFLKLEDTDLLPIPGFKQTLATKVCRQIKSIKTDLPTLMYASGVFPPSLGLKRFVVILEHYSYKELLNLNKRPEDIHYSLTQINGIGNNIAILFSSKLPEFDKFLTSVKKYISKKEVEKRGSSLLGQVVVFTGFRDKSLEEFLVSNGAKITNTVNKNVTKLVIKDSNSVTSSKYKKAFNLGIPIIDYKKYMKEVGYGIHS